MPRSTCVPVPIISLRLILLRIFDSGDDETVGRALAWPGSR